MMVTSLCEVVSELLGEEWDDQVLHEEREKEDALEVICGNLSQEDFQKLQRKN